MAMLVCYTPAAESDKVPCIGLPLSKSLAARVLTVSALSGKDWHGSLPDAADTIVLRDAFAAASGSGLGCPVDVWLGDGAASLRFFIAAAASVAGWEVKVDCSGQLRRRPLSTLVETLRSLGASIDYLAAPGECPLYIKGKRLAAPLPLEVDSSASSQFLSAMMLAAPLWRGGVCLKPAGERIVSFPYVAMTAAVMRKAGVGVSFNRGISVGEGEYGDLGGYVIEPDWSAASYIYEYVLLSGRPVRIQGLISPSVSLQGDSACDSLFRRVGVEGHFDRDGAVVGLADGECPDCFEADMTDVPDLVPAIAVGLALRGIRFRLSGVGHLQYKESRRLDALRNGLSCLGLEIGGDDSLLEYDGCPAGCVSGVAKIEVCGDHRMAMAFAMAAVAGRDVALSDPSVVGKSFPRFWEEMKKLSVYI